MKYQNIREIKTPQFKVRIRVLKENDEAALQELCEQCHEYSMLVTGRMPRAGDAAMILMDLPPDKRAEDKFVYGMFRDKGLIGVLDIVKDYRKAGEWTIGLLMLAPDERGKGLGKQLHAFAKLLVVKNGGTTLRLGVLEENLRAKKFWEFLGYTETETVSRRYENKSHRVLIMKMQL